MEFLASILGFLTIALFYAALFAAVGTSIMLQRRYREARRKSDKERLDLESYLRSRLADDEGRHSLAHLKVHLRMTEAELLEAARNSAKIGMRPGLNDAGIETLYLVYAGKR